MSIYDVIKDDHRKVIQLFEDIRECRDPDDRFALFENLREELTIHAKAEERVFYRRLEKDAGARERLEESIDEHRTMETLLARLQDLEPNSSQFESTLNDLEEVVQDHVREEESDLFQRARRVVGDDSDNSIARQFQNEKGRIQGRDFSPV